MISNCSHDENGRLNSGAAGDQTGKEWAVVKWYNRPWTHVLRHPNVAVREKIAKLSRAAALNDNIGYDQYQRTTFWRELKAAGYDPAKIKTKCESDCSASTAAIIKAAGHQLDIDSLKTVSEDSYSGNIREVLKKAGFVVLTEKKYLESPDYLLPGDVLLYEHHHVAINLDEGSKVTSKTTTGGKLMNDLVRGDEGSQVKTLQRLLKALKFYDGKIDGKFGQATEDAVKAFQEAKNLDIKKKGTVGSKTWECILKKC